MTKKLNGNKIKRNFLIALLAFFTIIFSNMTVLAANESNPTSSTVDISSQDTAIPLPKVNRSTNDTIISPLSIYGYGSTYTDNLNGRFTVYAPGSSSSVCKVTLKTSKFASNVSVAFDIYRPDGTLALGDQVITGNAEKIVSFPNAQPGTYTIYYKVVGVIRGRVHAWVYNS